MEDFKVNLDALEGFADQLDQRLAALRAARRPASTIPLGGAPAWEGQALFDAYNLRANDIHELLTALQTEVQTAVKKARDQVHQVGGLDENARRNNDAHTDALDGGGLSA
jgi:hypothetical protein